MTGISRKLWGRLADGSEVDLFTLTHESGLQVAVTTYGATLVELGLPDAQGRLTDIVLGYDDLTGYSNDRCYFGTMVGRVANRIARARFRLNGDDHVLDANHGVHHLHGGQRGFNTRLWSATPVQISRGPSLILEYVSPDGEQGYPGRLDVAITYTLAADTLRMDCRAYSDKTTIVNLTSHGYFNLSGTPETGIGDHELTLFSRRYLPTDREMIPTGKIRDVRGTRLDFTRPVRLERRLHAGADSKGYDHFYLLDHEPGKSTLAARLVHPPSGRMLEIATTQPGVQFYTGGGIPAGLPGKNGTIYGPGAGLCLETQGYPDAPNHPGFPSIVLRPGERYEHSTEYRFSGIRTDSTQHL